MEVLPYLITVIFVSALLYISVKMSVIQRLNNNTISIKRYSLYSYFFLFIAYIYMIIFSVFRVIEPGIGGIDAYSYKYYFLKSSEGLINSLNLQNYEWGYGFLVWVIRNVTSDYKIFLFLIYSLMFLILIKCLKYVTWNQHTIWVVMLLIALFFNSFNTLRVILSVFLGITSFIYIYDRRRSKAWLITFIAISIHISAVILIPMHVVNYLISKEKIFKPKYLLSLVSILLVAALISVNLLKIVIRNTKYGIYLYRYSGLSLGTYTMIFIITILSIYKYHEIVKTNPFNKILINILPVGLIIVPLQWEFGILYRMTLYFLPVMYMLIPAIIASYKVTSKNNLHYYLIKMGLLLYLIARLYIFFVEEVYSSGVPYFNYLF